MITHRTGKANHRLYYTERLIGNTDFIKSPANKIPIAICVVKGYKFEKQEAVGVDYLDYH